MVTSKEILEKANLDWTVSQRALFGPKGERTNLYGQFIDGTDHYLGSSSDRYHISQNEELADVMVNYFGSELNIDNISGGCLQGGRRIYFTLKGDNLFKGTTAELEQRLIIRNSHDGSIKLTFGFQDLVLVCTNGMTQWLERSKGERVAIMHTSSMKQKLNQFDQLYANYLNFSEKKHDMYKQWMSTPISKDLAYKGIATLNGVKEEHASIVDVDEFKEHYSTRKFNIIEAQRESMDIELARQGYNKWGMFNGFTNFTTHEIGNKSEAERRDGLLLGSGYNLNNKAFALVEAL